MTHSITPIGNYYSKGESRITPLYEWNGWEKVYRTKKSNRSNVQWKNPGTSDSSMAIDIDIVGPAQPPVRPSIDSPSSSDVVIILQLTTFIIVSFDSETSGPAGPPQGSLRKAPSEQPILSVEGQPNSVNKIQPTQAALPVSPKTSNPEQDPSHRPYHRILPSRRTHPLLTHMPSYRT